VVSEHEDKAYSTRHHYCHHSHNYSFGV